MTSALALLLAANAFAAPAPMKFSLDAMDRKADPCADFYQYSCGGWMAKNEIPADQSRWGRFWELNENSLAALRDILEAVSKKDPKRDAVDQKIGDHYASCMDEAGIEKKGAAPLKPELDAVAALTREKLPDTLASLNSRGIGAAFEFGAAQDLKDSSQVIAWADQGGLGLPDRDYYFKADEKSVELRKAYVRHVAKMFQLLGEPAAQAAAAADVVMNFEVKLASASQDKVARRDPRNLDHRMTPAELRALAPEFPWENYFALSGAPTFTFVNAASPDFLKAAAKLAAEAPLSDWKTYLRWRVVHSRAALLPKSFVDEDFAFYGKTLTGAKEIKARWKRCTHLADQQLGEALGRRYVEKTFGEQGKKRMLELVAGLEAALKRDIDGLDWMTPATKKRAQEKLATVANKIGYPDAWRDYSSYQVKRGDAVGNDARGDVFEWKRQLAKIGKPVDRKEWLMSPPTVNAYYDGQMNNINFPAGILQPPFYDNAMDDAVNFGAIGAVIGHELTHGFDDEGRRYDAQGNLKDWWTKDDSDAFDKRAQCLVDEYSGFIAIGDLHLNGKLTLGENTADNGGLRIAHMALMDALKGKTPAPVDGYTPEQRLFLGWGQVWCTKMRDEAARLQAQTNPHSPGHDRVNGVVANMPEFAKAFSCKAGQPMVRGEKSCRVW